MKFACLPLKDAVVYWRALASIQTVWSERDYLMMLRKYAAVGARVVIARHDQEIAGSIIWMQAPVESIEIPVEHRVASEKVLIWTGMFVDKGYRGRGLSYLLYREMARDGVDHCYTHALTIHHATPEIASWVKRLPGEIETNIPDPNGYPVCLFPLDNPL